MATQLQIRRGTSSQVAAFTGAEGEIVVNTTNDSVHVNDGSTAGGFELARADLNNVSDTSLNAALTGNTVSALTVTSLTSSGINVTGTVTADALTVQTTNGLNALLESTTSYQYLQFKNSAETNNFIGFVSDDFVVSPANNQKLIVTAEGNVGIGTSSPDSVLEANITTSGSGANNNTAGSSIGIGSSGTTQPILGMRWTGASHVGISGSAFSTQIVNDTVNSNAFEMYTTGASPLVLGTGAAERMRISANGYVNPKANVANTNAPDTQGLHFGWNYSNGAGESLIVFNKGAGTTGGLTFVDNSSSGTHDEIMRLEGGNLLVGTTTTGSYTDGKLSVFGDGSVPAATFKNAGNTGQFCANFWNAAGSGTRTLINFTTNASPSVVGSISTNGSTTAYNTSSDYRLKENIADADDAGSKVDAIQVRKFDWIADGAHQDYGMVAQELQTVAPEAVSAPEDPEEMMGVDYSKLVPMLVKEIQSLRARVQQLENN